MVSQDQVEHDEPDRDFMIDVQDYLLTRDREKRASKPKHKYGFTALAEMMAYAFVTVTELSRIELKTYAEAMSSKEA
uniref:Uncharacterized protein n=1 Tax=Cannabis sativa TaxID=3483 RepID=A0A803PDC8_CANSA